MEEVRAKNIAAVQKVADIVLTEQLGLLKQGLVSASIATALHALQEAMQIQSEKHLAQLENPTENLAGVVFDGMRLAEIEREYAFSMPTIATEEVESAFWSPITDARQLKPITHLEPSKSMDHKALEKELKERAGIAAAMEKLKKEQQKVVLYSRKTQARMVAKTQALENSEEEDDDATVKKIAEARQGKVIPSSDEEGETNEIPAFAPMASTTGNADKGSKRPISEVEEGRDEDHDNTSRAHRPRMSSQNLSDEGESEYTWNSYQQAFQSGDFDVVMLNVPVMLRILQDIMTILGVTNEDPLFSTISSQIMEFTREPTSQSILTLVEFIVSTHTIDNKYLQAAHTWQGTNHCMRGTTSEDDIYGNRLLEIMEQRFGASGSSA
ncbi:hypothetical protein PAXRUDRAFT_20006 [Paxillus rubicundulus Ve08.2h10]|uniref:Uncharacterized protein n=1 Tax=Paxillus rubicundulus Ve08.2h10 TaxID=930991 RepID=A0A0D0CG08_9AGAM|nr:hypothetical protein PAXRUDRAFT_20006 [Paxillus rubicundulus Ve08.2h10]